MRLSAWRYRRFHSSYGIGWVCFGLCIGLGSASFMRLPTSGVLVVVLVCIILTALIKARWYAIVVAVCAAMIVGCMRGSFVAEQLESTKQLSGHAIQMSGSIREDPQKTARGDTRIVLGDIRYENQSYAGDIWMTTRGEHDYSRGDRIEIKGVMKPGFGVYQLSASYVDIVSHKSSSDPLLTFRDNFSSALRQHVVEPSASLGIGFVVGQKTSLPTQLEEQLRIVGLTHLVVASGYNLTILVRFAKRLFEKHSKFLVAFFSSSMIAGFIGISGASPSMVRAGLVAGLSIAAWYYGRRFHPLLLILYVAALTAMINPVYLWADVGWWLSFLAFTGVLVVAPLLTRLIVGKRTVPSVVQIVFETFAAQLMTLPLILMVFGNLPVFALVANMVSAPLIPFAMLLTFITGITAMVFPVIVVLVALPAEIMLSYFVAVARWLSHPEWAQVAVGVTPYGMIMMYGVIATTMILVWRRLRYNFRSQSLIE